MSCTIGVMLGISIQTMLHFLAFAQLRCASLPPPRVSPTRQRRESLSGNDSASLIQTTSGPQTWHFLPHSSPRHDMSSFSVAAACSVIVTTSSLAHERWGGVIACAHWRCWQRLNVKQIFWKLAKKRKKKKCRLGALGWSGQAMIVFVGRWRHEQRTIARLQHNAQVVG